MGRLWTATFALVAACSFEHGSPSGLGGGGGGDARDAPADVVGGEPAMMTCYGTGLGVQVCPASPPSGSFTPSGGTLVITDPGSPDCAALVGATAGDYCAIVATQITVSGNLRAAGHRPLVLVSTSTLVVSGTIDVSSQRVTGIVGAGGDVGPCGDGDSSGSTGGGAGGTFGSLGGNGGNVPGGTHGPAVAPATLRGGCPGTIGKDFLLISGPPGPGGGAVDLIATGTITISGTINASGAGGWGALQSNNGGQGGGSGGMIALDAPSVRFTGTPRLFANGGGGGGGSNGTGIGANGDDPTAPGAGGSAGDGAGNSGGGGDGGNDTNNGGSGGSGSSGDGGGGGGGGVGVIRVFQSTAPSGGMVSPPFS